MKLLLMGCSATKRADPEPMPAIDRYDGPMWQSLRARLAELPLARAALSSGALQIMVLSARHGFINAQSDILDYDQRLTPALAAKMAHDCSYDFQQMPDRSAAADAIMFAGGATYRDAMRSAVANQVAGRVTETDGAGIGEHRAQLGAWLARHFTKPATEVDRVMQQTGMDRMQAHYHVRGREIIRLRTQSPLRSAAGQSDAAHLPLFVTANEPTLF